MTQSSIDRYASATDDLQQMIKSRNSVHRQGGPSGLHRALRGPIVILAVAAFEGFTESLVEDIMSTVRPNVSVAAKMVAVGKIVSPSAAVALKAVQKALPKGVVPHTEGFDVTVEIPGARNRSPSRTGWWWSQALDWEGAARYTEAWVNVRHALAHGGASARGLGTWPSPLNARTVSADEVLRISYPRSGTPGHVLDYRNVESCVRAFDQLAIYLATEASRLLGGRPLTIPVLASSFMPPLCPAIRIPEHAKW